MIHRGRLLFAKKSFRLIMAAAAEKEVQDFEKELMAFMDQKLPISASRISSATKLALKHAKHYKHVVHVVERFFARSSTELKLYGLYVVDSISKAVSSKLSGSNSSKSAEHSQKAFTALLSRFELKLEGMLGSVATALSSDKDKDRARRITTSWRQQKIYSDQAWLQWARKFPTLFDMEALEKEQTLPDADFLAATLAKINKDGVGSLLASTGEVKNVNPLEFDYGDDSDLTFDNNKQPDGKRHDSVNVDNDNDMPGSLAAILSSIPAGLTASISSISQPSTPAIQTQFTAHQQQQLASLLALQGIPLVSPDIQSPSAPVSATVSAQAQPLSASQKQEPQPKHLQNVQAEPANSDRVREHDPSIELDQIKILTRTLYVGGIVASTTESDLHQLFHNYRPEQITVFPEKFHAFVRLETRDLADAAKRDFWNNKTTLSTGEPLRVNWACGTSRKDIFDRRQGFSVLVINDIPEQELHRICREIGIDFLRDYTLYLQQTYPTKSGSFMRPYHLGGLCIEEPEFLDISSSVHKRPSAEKQENNDYDVKRQRY